MGSHRNRHFGKGFTLLEVMVALAIFAATAGLLLMTDGQGTRHTRMLNDKLLAAQLAEDRLNLRLATGVMGGPGETRHLIEHRSRSWTLVETVMVTSEPRFYRVEVAVFEGDTPEVGRALPLARLTSFVREGVTG